MVVHSMVVLLALVAPITHAQVFQCKQPDGRLTYQDSPCALGAAGRVVNTHPNTVSNREERELYQRERAAAPALALPAPGTVAMSGAACPSEQELRNWETSASSVTSKDARRWARMAEDGRRCRAGLPPVERRAAPPPIPVAPMPPTGVASCDPGGCWDSAGNRYNGNPRAGTLHGPNGQACQILGGMLHCN
jgi:hypothetical protein